MLLEKNDWKKKILQFAPCVLIVLLGAVSIMIFNKARFDSVFEFGQSYQLTVTNQTNLKVNYYTLISFIFIFNFLHYVILKMECRFSMHHILIYI